MSGFVRVNKRVVTSKPASPAPTPTQPETPPTTATPHDDPTKLGTGGSMARPVLAASQIKSQQRLLSQVAAAAQIKIPNGCKPWVSNQFLTSIGVRDLDSILGGGLPLHTVNTIISDPRTKHHDVYTKAHLWDGYLRKQRCIFISSMNDAQALRLSKEVLKPALTNQEQRAPSSKLKPSTSAGTSPDGDVHTTDKDHTTTTTTATKNAPSSKSIDDDEEEEDLFSSKKQPTKQSKITQGSVQNALHDGSNSKLTIAWQYDKYKNKTMDDSNLSGVNDDEITEDNHSDHNSDVEDNSSPESESKNGSVTEPGIHTPAHTNTNQQPTRAPHSSTCTTSSLATDFDFHIITPQSLSDNHSQLISSYPSLFPIFDGLGVEYHRFAILKKLTTLVNAPPSTTALAQLSSTTPPHETIVPSRIVIELTPELLTDYASTTTTVSKAGNRNITTTQFLYSLHSLATTTHSIITLLIPSSVMNNTVLYSLIMNLSQLVFSLASFTAQTTLSNQTILQSQLGSAYNLFGDKHDGLLTVYRLPRINTPSYSYKLPDSTLFLYRLKKQLTATLTSTSTSTIPTFGIAKLVLPPEVSRSGDAHSSSSNTIAKDLFDEAIVEITKRAKFNANNENNSSSEVTKSNGTNATDQLKGAKACPTCGNDIKNDSVGKESTSFGSSSKTAKQQQLMIERQADMIIEEGEEEDEDVESYKDELE